MTSKNGRPKPKEKRVEVRLDEELYEEIAKKAKRHGVSIGSVFRALGRIFVKEENEDWMPDGIEAETKRAPKQPRKTKNSS